MIRILYTDLLKYTFLGDASVLQSYDPQDVYTDPNLVQPIVAWSFPVPKTCNYCVVQNHNFATISVDNVLQLRAATLADYSNEVIIVNGMSNGDYISLYEFASVTYKYWRITIVDPPSEALFLGNLFVDLAFDINNPQWGHVDGDQEFETYEGSSLSGRLRAVQIIQGRPTWEMQFSLLDNTFKAAFQTFQQTVQGVHHPFYFIDMSSIIHYVHLAEDYTPVLGHRYNKNNVLVTLYDKETV